MNRMINLKKRKMIFEKKSLHVVIPLDPVEGLHYIEPVHDYQSNDDLDYIYKITVWEQDWMNPTMDGKISWESEISCTLDSDEEIERWRNRLHKITTINCNMMTRSLRCVEIEVRDQPMYDRLSEVDDFLNIFERQVSEQHWFDALKLVLRTTLARWWGTHQQNFEDWQECIRMMHL